MHYPLRTACPHRTQGLSTALHTETYRVDSRVWRPVSTGMRDICAARRLHPRAVSSSAKRTVFSMRNGLYSLHMHMLDGVKGRDSGVIILRDGKLIGGGPYFWSIGTYSVGDGTWKGEFTTN